MTSKGSNYKFKNRKGTEDIAVRFKRIVKTVVESPVYLYAFLTFVCMLCIYLRLISDSNLGLGNYFFKNWQEPDLKSDTGMDFFNSIICVSGRVPYTEYNTLYPPLANLFFWLLCITIPADYRDQWPSNFLEVLNEMKYSDLDARFHQGTMVLFVLFIVVTAITILLIGISLKESKLQGALLGISLIFSYGIQYAYERGNIILIALIFTMFFLMGYRSENKVIRELALISLAIAAGLKLYPAVYGILIVREKRWADALRTIIYGICAFILPFFVFDGVEGMKHFIWTFISFNSNSAYASLGYNFTRICENICTQLSAVLPFSFEAIMSKGAIRIINWLLVATMLVATLVCRKESVRLSALLVAILFAQNSVSYTLVFAIPVLTIFLVRDSFGDRSEKILFILISLLSLPLPILTQSETVGISNITLFKQYIVAALAVYIIVQLAKDIRSRTYLRQKV